MRLNSKDVDLFHIASVNKEVAKKEKRMSFKCGDYDSGDEFREEEGLYTLFYYDELCTGPFMNWCTEYYFRKIGENRYRLVYIDRYDNQISVNEEFSATELVDFLNKDASDRNLQGYWDLELSELFPDMDSDYFERHYNPLTANLVKAVMKNDDSVLFAVLERLYYDEEKEDPIECFRKALDTVIEKEPITPQEFVDILSSAYPIDEIMEGLWTGKLMMMKWNQSRLGGLKGHSLREAISAEEADVFLDNTSTDFFDELIYG